MSSDTLREQTNSAIQLFALHLEQFMQISLKVIKQFFADSIFVKSIDFSPLQSTLLNVLLVLLLFTIVLIGYSWKVYGIVITEKFVRPSTLKEIEELKSSVDKLKLPKEHSPRI
ncbi:uncharacterized protein LOC106090144 [Stomoxys calcitrans]|uniref:Uncharacterized protein n=1 Tax=Stomoxys calcitrans TaxID=35570 RepID=A0A1I8Q5K5_STOCA|nr:uncharacterized protein LOC106090144 [Stomoxys calcitrans]